MSDTIYIDENEIGIVGDLHLGKHDNEHWFKAYDNLYDWIVKEFRGKVKTIMFLGDIFDGHKAKTTEKAISFKMLHYISEFFDNLSSEFNIIMYAGNHCCYYKDSCKTSALVLFKNKPNITVVEETTLLKSSDKTYKIVPWACDITIGGKVDGIFGHFDITTFKLNGFKVSEHGFGSKELLDQCDHVYTGHYHHYQKRFYKNKKASITYIGSPLQLSWAEADKKSYIAILDLSKNAISSLIENTVSPEFKKVKASDIISKKGVDTNDDVIDIIWDIDMNEQTLIKINDKLESNGTSSYKHTFKDKFKSVVGEIADINSGVDIEEIVTIYTKAIVDIEDSDRETLNTDAIEYIKRTSFSN